MSENEQATITDGFSNDNTEQTKSKTGKDNITLTELENHLFKSADEIRNVVDKTDYKDYILPLVYYKVISDTYQDEIEELLTEHKQNGDLNNFKQKVSIENEPYETYEEAYIKTILEQHESITFIIPHKYTWENLLKQDTEKLAETVDKALTALQEANRVHSVSFPVTYNEELFAENHPNKLRNLIEHLEEKDMSLKRVSADMLGQAYMSLVKHFASEEGRDGGEYFTPPNLVNLMVRILEPYENGASVHDPTCGSGGMLVEVARHIREEQFDNKEHAKKRVQGMRFTGQEISTVIHSIAQMNIALNDLEGTIEKGDTLSNPRFVTGDELDTFDYILANFPFSARWEKGDINTLPNRFKWTNKLPRKNRADYAFIMHIVAALEETGSGAVVIPHGVLFRNSEQEYREYLIENDLIEAIIGLPEKLFQTTGIPSAILILNKDKPDHKENTVQFINADHEDYYEELSNQNQLTETGISSIVSSHDEWKTEERVSRVVDNNEILENEYNLNIALYVDTTEPQEDISVEDTLSTIHDLETEYESLNNQLTTYMQQLKYEGENDE